MSEKQVRYLHHTYGAFLNGLFVYAEVPDKYDNLFTSEIDKLSALGLTRTPVPRQGPNNSHYLTSTDLSPTD